MNDIYTHLIMPLTRLIITMCVGLALAGLLESLHWTRFVARLARPLTRAGHLGETAAASFALAFFSPMASNTLLAEAYRNGTLSRRELLLSNLFNSSPTFLVHLPTLFSLIFAFLGTYAFVYVGLTCLAAVLRTLGTVIAGRLLLPAPQASDEAVDRSSQARKGWRETASMTLKRLSRRIRKILLFTVPIYCLFYWLQQAGCFEQLEQWLASHAQWLSFLNPKSISIIAMYLVSESGAALSAAAALMHAGSLGPHEIIMALLAGNILSSPMRAVRHQFPAYAGYFSPSVALLLVVFSQCCRAVSLILVGAAYYYAVLLPPVASG